MPISKAQNAAIEQIRRFHEIGRNGGEPKGIDEFTLRKVRRFSDATKGYSDDALDRLVDQIKGHRRKNRDATVFGWAHVVKLLTIRNGERDRWQQRAIEKNWSVRKLGREIAKRVGHRRPRTGRLPGFLKSKKIDDLYAQLERACISWQRLIKHLERVGDTQGSSVYEEINKKLHAIDLPMKALYDCVVKKLSRLRGKTKKAASRT
jgi:hypothetical protein